jgi:hypothetical protein
MENKVQSNNPVTIKEWIIVIILSAIPLVNIVMLFVWAFGGNANKSIENWAKASLLVFLFMIAFFIIIAVVFGLLYQL